MALSYLRAFLQKTRNITRAMACIIAERSGAFMTTLLLLAALLSPLGVTAQARMGVVSGQLSSRDGQSVAGVRIGAMAVPEPNVPVT